MGKVQLVTHRKAMYLLADVIDILDYAKYK
jgi:hypothetical protein